MKRVSLVTLIIAVYASWWSCQKEESVANTTASIETEEQNREAHKSAKEEAERQNELGYQLLARIVDKNSDVYTKTEVHTAYFTKMIKNEPARFQSFLVELNNFRFSQGLAALKPEAFLQTSLSLADVNNENSLLASTTPETVAECIAGHISVPEGAIIEPVVNEAGLKLNAPQLVPQWDPSKPCPNNCVCAAAHASARAFGYGHAWAQCRDGTTIEATAYAEAYAYASAFAFACLPNKPDQCDDKQQQPECEIDPDAQNPVVVAIKNNPGCFGLGESGCLPDLPTSNDNPKDDSTSTATTIPTETSTDNQTGAGIQDGGGL